MNTELIKRRLKKFLDKTSVEDLVNIIESQGYVVADIDTCDNGIESPMMLLRTKTLSMSSNVSYSSLPDQDEVYCNLSLAA